MTLKLYSLNREKEKHAETHVVQCLGVTHFTLNDYQRKTLYFIYYQSHNSCKMFQVISNYFKLNRQGHDDNERIHLFKMAERSAALSLA